ncbi:hypothetical protein FEM48_Zijuj08G0058900 [Ziziphus jujuba var. spinosa]|uniref:MATH domain-containing protein n=1 Tax=Ziziphus jujuba var. spinosa TaxID=714518 RepID=A0A978UXC8_ZIZJJ|nr:hypothetical protein FEM48_Zijuj08G0058900 [Ziziphus jujuba var. spinosa]
MSLNRLNFIIYIRESNWETRSIWTERSILRCKRDISPAHYMMKIQPYSMLAKSGGDKYDSDFFEVGGHKWQELEKSDKNGYISLYLAIVETDTYLPEVCVIDKTHKCETLSFVKEPPNDVFTWKLKEFSTKNCCYESQVFTIGERKWTLKFYPEENSLADGLSLSLFLCQVDGSGMPPIFASYMLRILDIARDRRREIMNDFYKFIHGEAWFRSSPGDKWGYENFMPLKYLNEFVVNDTVTIEVQFLNLSVMKILPEWK